MVTTMPPGNSTRRRVPRRFNCVHIWLLSDLTAFFCLTTTVVSEESANAKVPRPGTDRRLTVLINTRIKQRSTIIQITLTDSFKIFLRCSFIFLFVCLTKPVVKHIAKPNLINYPNPG